MKNNIVIQKQLNQECELILKQYDIYSKGHYIQIEISFSASSGKFILCDNPSTLLITMTPHIQMFPQVLTGWCHCLHQ